MSISTTQFIAANVSTTGKAVAVAGTRIATVGRSGSRMAKCGPVTVPIFAGKIYEAQPRQSDGAMTWRLVSEFGGDRAGNRPSDRFIAELEAAATARGLAFCDEYQRITHGRTAYAPEYY